MLLTAGVVATGLVLLLTIGVRKPEQAAAPEQSKPAATSRPAAPPAGAVAPVAAVVAPEDRPRVSDLAALDSWARGLAKPTKLPANVLVAYGRAEMWMRDKSPGCHLSWPTLAGLGQVQAVGAGPLPVPDPIWQRFSARATSDGKPADPRNVDDAALTAAQALCSANADLTVIQGWWTAVLTYTGSPSDTADALREATTFARARP